MNDNCPECDAYRWEPCDETCTVGLNYKVEQLTADCDHWRKRAEAAEESVETLLFDRDAWLVEKARLKAAEALHTATEKFMEHLRYPEMSHTDPCFEVCRSKYHDALAAWRSIVGGEGGT